VIVVNYSNNNSKDFYKIEELSKKLGVASFTIWRAVRKGEIIAIKCGVIYLILKCERWFGWIIK